MSPRAVVLMGHVRAPVPFDKPLSVLRRSWGRERSGEAPSTDIVRDQPRNTARASTSRRAATTIQISVYAGGRGAVGQTVHLPRASRDLIRQLGGAATRQRSSRSAKRHAGRAELAARKSAVDRVSRGSPVQTAMRNCARDEGRSFEAGSQVLASNRCKLLSSKAM